MHHKIREYARLYEEGAVFTAFDTETTGLYCERDRIIEIGAVKFDKTGILGTYEILIYPEISVPASAYKVHGISDLMLSGCPVFAAAAPAFLDFIEGTRLIAHNAPFDTGFVNSELQRAGRPALASPSVPAADTVTPACAAKFFCIASANTKSRRPNRIYRFKICYFIQIICKANKNSV